MRTHQVIFILFLFISLLFANAVIVEWKAEPGQNKITLRWKTSSEENIQKFVIERSNDNQHFFDIGEVTAKGPGFEYQFVDTNMGRVSSLFYYRLRIVNQDGTFQHNDSLPVIPNLSDLTRTWGSIKALFR